jgi:hypothetical protein
LVTRESNSNHRVILIEHLPLLRNMHSQILPFVWDTLNATVGGNYLLMGSHNLNCVMRLNRNHRN